MLRERIGAERGEGSAGPERSSTRRFRSLSRIPPRSATDEWRDLRAELARRLQLIGLHPPKRVIDIPEQWAQTYFDLMPIHEKLRGRDFPTTRNYLRAQLCNIHEEFVERAGRCRRSCCFLRTGAGRLTGLRCTSKVAMAYI